MGKFRKGFRSPLHKARTVYAVRDLTGRYAVIEVEGEVRSLRDSQTYPVLMCNHRTFSNESMTAWFVNYEKNILERFKICIRFTTDGKKMSMHVTALQGQGKAPDGALAYTYVLDQGGMSARLMLDSNYFSSLSHLLKRKEWASILVHIATYCAPESYSRLVNAGKQNAREIAKTVRLAAMLGEDRNAAIGLLIGRLGEVADGKVNVVLDKLQECCEQAVADRLTEKAILPQPPRARQGSPPSSSDVTDQLLSLPCNLRMFGIDIKGAEFDSYGESKDDIIASGQAQSLPITIKDVHHCQSKKSIGNCNSANLAAIVEQRSGYGTEQTQEPHLPLECSDKDHSIEESYSALLKESDTSPQYRCLFELSSSCIVAQHQYLQNS